jgi:hypothetical protein
MIHLGPTITSGQDIDENWISGLSQAAVRCDGNNRWEILSKEWNLKPLHFNLSSRVDFQGTASMTSK